MGNLGLDAFVYGEERRPVPLRGHACHLGDGLLRTANFMGERGIVDLFVRGLVRPGMVGELMAGSDEAFRRGRIGLHLLANGPEGDMNLLPSEEVCESRGGFGDRAIVKDEGNVDGRGRFGKAHGDQREEEGGKRGEFHGRRDSNQFGPWRTAFPYSPLGLRDNRARLPTGTTRTKR